MVGGWRAAAGLMQPVHVTRSATACATLCATACATLCATACAKLCAVACATLCATPSPPHAERTSRS